MTPAAILAFLRRNKLAVEASVGSGGPQAAVVGVAISDTFEIFFDTLRTSRKAENLRRDPRIALVIGWDLEEGCTAQLEGIVDEPSGPDLERLKQLYFESFPDGVARAAWPDIAYFRLRPTWLRFSDFTKEPPLIVELGAGELSATASRE